MKKLLSILFISISFLSFSQSQKRINKEKAQEQILKLKNEGAIIIRILSSKKNIDLYRKQEQIALADRLQNELDINNYLISLAFQDTNFNFCPVYVIYANDYTKVLKGEKSGYFLDKELKIDSNITLNEDFFLFIDRGGVFEDEGTDFESSSRIIIQDAFVFKDKSLKQLSKPFPYYKTVLGYSIFETSIKYSGKLKYIKKRKSVYFETTENILRYYSDTYKLEGNELILPGNIYDLNRMLTKYYNKVVLKENKKKEPLLRNAPY